MMNKNKLLVDKKKALLARKIKKAEKDPFIKQYIHKNKPAFSF